MPMSWEMLYAERARTMKNSEIREFFKLTEQPDVISFAGGFPSPDCFPKELIAEALQKLVMEEGASALQYGPTEGHHELRSFLAQKMNSEGVSSTAENILITNGSQQGLDLIGKIFLNPGDKIVVEEPGYVGGLGAFNNYQADILPVSVDENGLRTDLLEKELRALSFRGEKVKAAYIVPNFQNPTGVTLSLERRRHLLKLAEQYNFSIIEDNPYGELCFDGVRLPSLKSLDTEGRVIYLGSFSKTFIPGIRVGWIVADRCLIEKIVSAKQATDLCSNTLGQHLVHYFNKRESICQHTRKLVAYYRRKRDLMLSCMEKYFPAGVNWTVPQGGFFIWVTFPVHIHTRELLFKSIEQKRVAYVDGGGFFVNGNGKNTARFSYSEATEREVEEGIARLGELLNEELGGSRRKNGVASART